MKTRILVAVAVFVGVAAQLTFAQQFEVFPGVDPVSGIAFETSAASFIADGLPANIYRPSNPKFRFLADALLLGRSGVSSQPLILDSGLTPVFDAAQIGVPTHAGLRLDFLFYDYDDRFLDHQFGYLQTERAVDFKTITAPGAFYLFFNGIPVQPQDTYTVKYATKLTSGEFNLRHEVAPWITLLAGVRATEVREKFDILYSFQPVSGVFAASDNDLFGGQVGADFLFWTNGFTRLEATAKAGMFYNDKHVSARALNAQHQWHSGGASFLGEAQIALVIPAWPFNLRIGYQLLWMTGIALAPDQSASLDVFTGAGSIDVSTPVYQGGFIGLEYIH